MIYKITVRYSAGVFAKSCKLVVRAANVIEAVEKANREAVNCYHLSLLPPTDRENRALLKRAKQENLVVGDSD